nr:unnamed protein product [Digitaria exilis]
MATSTGRQLRRISRLRSPPEPNLRLPLHAPPPPPPGSAPPPPALPTPPSSSSYSSSSPSPQSQLQAPRRRPASGDATNRSRSVRPPPAGAPPEERLPDVFVPRPRGRCLGPSSAAAAEEAAQAAAAPVGPGARAPYPAAQAVPRAGGPRRVGRRGAPRRARRPRRAPRRQQLEPLRQRRHCPPLLTRTLSLSLLCVSGGGVLRDLDGGSGSVRVFLSAATARQKEASSS